MFFSELPSRALHILTDPPFASQYEIPFWSESEQEAYPDQGTMQIHLLDLFTASHLKICH